MQDFFPPPQLTNKFVFIPIGKTVLTNWKVQSGGIHLGADVNINCRRNQIKTPTFDRSSFA